MDDAGLRALGCAGHNAGCERAADARSLQPLTLSAMQAVTARAAAQLARAAYTAGGNGHM